MMSPQFASLLASGRAEFNRRVAEARRRYPSFDTAAFSSFLQGPADQVIRAVCAAPAASAAERLPAVAMAAFDVALELVAHGQGGGIAVQVWCELVPRYAALLCAQPAQVLGMLTNAALHLEKSGHARPAQLLALMAELAPQVADLQQLSAIGQVCAWRAGMAHFRQGAIAAADKLPAPLALAAFGAPAGMGGGAWPELRERLLRDPWWMPDETARQRVAHGTEVGSFTGLGGAFPEPPEVRPASDGFWVRSGDRYALLLADACGAVLHAATQDEYEHPQLPATRAKLSQSGQRLTVNGREFTVDLPADALRIVCNEHTVAITSPYSHAVRVLPLP
jgi:hypothetical protein